MKNTTMRNTTMRNTKLLNIVLVFAGISLVSSSALAIQKCKDAEGNWHYGDYAEEKCSTTEVTELNKRGFITDKIDAPKTEEELKLEAEQEKQEEEELARLKKEQDERDRVLSIYEREEDIDRQRDNQLASVDGNIRVHKAYLKQMDKKIERLNNKAAAANKFQKEKIEKELVASKSRIEEFSVELKRLEEQKLAITEKFALEKEMYRKYKGKSE